MATQDENETPRTFHVFVAENSRSMDGARRVTLKKNEVHDLEHFLEVVTERVNPAFGYARDLVTPIHGKRKIKSLEDLRPNELYVCKGPGFFRRERYREGFERPGRISSRRSGPKAINDPNHRIPPVIHARPYRDKSGLALKKNDHSSSLRIMVTNNLERLKKAIPVNISHRRKGDLQNIKDDIESFLKLDYAIRRMVIVNSGNLGDLLEVENASDLKTGMHVVVSNARDKIPTNFHFVTEGRPDFHTKKYPNLINGTVLPSLSRTDTVKHDRSLNKYTPLSGISKSEPESPVSKRSKRRPQRETDYDHDNGGVFRAKNQNNARGAKQVKDSGETNIERPVDQRKAEIVTEEEIYPIKETETPIPKGTELQKQPSDPKTAQRETKPSKEVKPTKQTPANLPVPTSNVNLPKEKDGEEEPPAVKKQTDGPSKGEVTHADTSSPEAKTEEVGKPAVATPTEDTDQSQVLSKPVLSKPDRLEVPKDAKSSKERLDQQEDDFRHLDEYDDDSFDVKPLDTSSYMNTNPSNNRSSTPKAGQQTDKHAVGDDKDKGDNRQKQEAATALQAGMRGVKARKDNMAAKNAQRERAEERAEERIREEEFRRQEEEDERRRYEEERRREEARQDEDMRAFEVQQEMERRQREDEESRRQEEMQEDIERQERERRESAERDLREREDADRRHQEEAATTIQAAFKGHKARKSHTAWKEKKVNDRSSKSAREQAEAATKIQAGFRGYKTRKAAKKQALTKTTNSPVNEGKTAEEQAATQIQAGFRGYKTRKDAAKRKADATELERQKAEASVKIQASYRGYKTRKQVKERKAAKQKEEDDKDIEDAATRIQAGFRGYKTRKEMDIKRKEEQMPSPTPSKTHSQDEEMEAAATKIQAGFRGFQTRKHHNTAKVMLMEGVESDVEQYPESTHLFPLHRKGQHILGYYGDLASKVQACFRSFQARQMLKKKFLAHDPSVVRIQAACNGFIARKKFNQQKNRESSQERNENRGTDKLQAIMKLQACFKGYIVRKGINQALEAMAGQSNDMTDSSSHMAIDVNVAAIRIQSCYRGHASRKRQKVNGTNTIEAAAQLKAAFRGFVARKTFIEATCNNGDRLQECTSAQRDESKSVLQEASSDLMREAAAVRIQSVYRGYTCRKGKSAQMDDSKFIQKEPHQELTREAAAVRIQSVYRGYTCRKGNTAQMGDSKFVPKASSSELTREAAAVRIQSVYRGYTCRKGKSARTDDSKIAGKESRPELTKETAAVRIQSVYRGYSCRKGQSALVDKSFPKVSCTELTKEAAAVKIQSVYRSYTSRKSAARNTNMNAGGPSESRDRDMLATKLQSCFRGHRARKLHTIRLARQRKAATELQAAVRGYVSRRRAVLNHLETRERNDVPLLSTPGSGQDAEKGPETFWTDTHIRMIPDNKLRAAALTINAAFQGYVTRQQNKHLFLSLPNKTLAYNTKSVTYVQACFRSYMARKRRQGTVRQELKIDLQGRDKTSDKASVQTGESKEGEVEREGESFREVEDEAGELHELQKNSKAVLHIQAAFRAYQTRKEINDVLSGSGQLIDMVKIDLAVSALKQKSERIRERTHTKIGEETDDWQIDWFEIKEIKDPKRNAAATAVQATVRANSFRKVHLRKQAAMKEDIAARKIQAQARGYLVRKNMSHVQTGRSIRSKAVTCEDKATELQAVFWGYQTRKEFHTILNLLHQDHEILSHLATESNGFRMRSLSGTDDMKLRMKLIAKTQASMDGFSTKSSKTDSPCTSARQQKQARSNSFVGTRVGLETPAQGTKSRSRADPDETRVAAATSIQAGFLGILARRKHAQFKKQHPVSQKREMSPKVKSRSSSKGSKDKQRVLAKLNADIEKKSNKGVRFIEPETREMVLPASESEEVQTDVPLVHTPVVIETDKPSPLSTPVTEKGDLEKAKEETRMIAMTAQKAKAQKQKAGEMNVSQPSSKEDEVKEREQVAAIKIQSSYRGFSVRKELKEMEAKRFDDEYEHWKQKRIKAATVIQSGWRGHKVRKDIQEQEDMLPDEFDNAEIPSKLLVINIGRSQEDIERTAARHDAASMVQVVFRACRSRRTLKMKSAIQRTQQRGAASLIQAGYLAYKERMSHKAMDSATRIQGVFRGNATRQRVQREGQAARLLQAGYRTHMKRKTTAEVRGKMDDAATLLQAAVRAFLVRKRAREHQEKIHSEKCAASFLQSAFHALHRRIVDRRCRAVASLQAAYFSHKVRVANVDHKLKAAVKIQAGYRGHLGRRLATKERLLTAVHGMAVNITETIVLKATDNILERDASATRIQACFRGYRTRRFVEADRERSRLENEVRRKQAEKRRQIRHSKATLVQACARAQKARSRKHADKLQEVQASSAVKIQALYRGYSFRKELEREREALSLISPPAFSPVPQEDELMSNARAIIRYHKEATKLQEAFRAYLTRQETNTRLYRKYTISLTTPRNPNSPSTDMFRSDKGPVRFQTSDTDNDRNDAFTLHQNMMGKIDAARVIQAAIAAHRKRQEVGQNKPKFERENSYFIQKRRHVAASTIAIAYRSFQKRKSRNAFRAEM